VPASTVFKPGRLSRAPAAPRGWRARGALAAAGALVLVGICTPAARATPTACNKVASPQGSDSGDGSEGAPFRTAQELVDALAPGEVGCLRAGTYGGGLTFEHGGAAGAAIVLRSSPGEEALVTGRVWVKRGANYVTVADLSLDGNYQDPSEKRLPSPTINASDVTFEHDDVTDDQTEICFVVGSGIWGEADSTVIAYDHIHDCGVLPAENHDHGIYMQDATNFQIVGNLIDHNADRGIQLYPQASGGVIADNVISENGEGLIFSGDEGVASSDDVVEHNLIVKSLIRSDIESWYPQGNPVGVGNVARDNCVSQRAEGAGFSSQENVVASPAELVATSAGGYTAVPGSVCAAALAGGPAPLTAAIAAKPKPRPRKPPRRNLRRHRRYGHRLRRPRRRTRRAHAHSHRRARASHSQARDRRR